MCWTERYILNVNIAFKSTVNRSLCWGDEE